MKRWKSYKTIKYFLLLDSFELFKLTKYLNTTQQMLLQEKCPIPETDHNISGNTSTLKGKKQEAEKKG